MARWIGARVRGHQAALTDALTPGSELAPPKTLVVTT
jgi:hypothetical protein